MHLLILFDFSGRYLEVSCPSHFLAKQYSHLPSPAGGETQKKSKQATLNSSVIHTKTLAVTIKPIFSNIL